MNYTEAFLMGMQKLKEAEIGEAQLDARLLLEEVCGTDHNTLLCHGDREVSEAEEEQYRKALEQRAVHVPLQHLLGYQDFMGLRFQVNEHVLIPRQDTEILVEEAMRYLHDGMRILDLCTGSGCILLSLLHYSNDCEGTGVDISKEALQVAALNAKFLCREEIPGDYLAKEKEILMEQAATENKPLNILEKMVEGRIAKELKEICLVDQLYFKDDELTVGKYIAKVAKEIGAPLSIKRYIRFETGEGIAKKEENFAEEVAKQMNKQ